MQSNELNEYFKYKCYKGLKARGLDNIEYKKRLDYEIEVILGMGFPGYFLIVYDFINWAKSNGIYIGPGRGSAAGSLVSFCLSITDLDPIKWDLMFERFLNPGRLNTMPDIDIDVAKHDRDRVIEYITQKYGADRVAHIATFNMMRAKAAVRGVTKALGHPYQVGDELSKLLLPPVHGKPQPLSESLQRVKELFNYTQNQMCTQAEILRWSTKVENLISSVGVHASGIVISNESLLETVPLFIGKSGEIATQWEMGNVEEIGLIKFDMLGVNALSKIQRAITLVEEYHNTKIDITSIPLEDEKVFAALRSGDVVGVFQLEASSGMQDLLIKIRPSNIEDLTALVAIYRPGPLGSPEVESYLAVRAGWKEPTYSVPELKPILEKTNGLIIYQEQCMRIATDLCGYTLSEADDLRKAIGKKKAELMAKQEKKFKQGWINHGLPADKGNQLWELIVGFASYAFNKSHAAAYAFITYQTAWLKVHYPTEYLCALMISESDNMDDIIKCITECKRLGIKILPPHVNTSKESFVITDTKEIRFGLGPIKNLGEKPVANIIGARDTGGQFKSLEDFCNRVDLSIINKLKLTSLVKAGAFDELGSTRAAMLQNIDKIWEYKSELKSYNSKLETYKKKLDTYNERQDLIAQGKTKLSSIKPPIHPLKPLWPTILELDELTESERQGAEHELLGFYISSHPLDNWKQLIAKSSTIQDINSMPDKAPISLIAVITSITEITSSKNKQKMAFLHLEDLTGSIESVIFSSRYEKHKSILIEGVPLKFEGSIQITESDDGKVVKIRLDNVRLLMKDNVDYLVEQPRRIEARIKLGKAHILAKLLDNYSGDLHDIYTYLEAEDGTVFEMPVRRIGNFKTVFIKELSRLTNEE